MKKKILFLVTTGSMVLMPVSVFASESGTANTAVVSAMTSTANDMVATGTSLIPVALTVVTLSMVVVYGVKIFKRLIGRS